MHRMPIPDEEDLPLSLPAQPPQEPEQHGGAKRFLEEHEAHLSSIGDRRDQVATEPPARPRDRRRVAPPPVTPAALVLRPHTHLIFPVNLGLFLQGARSD